MHGVNTAIGKLCRDTCLQRIIAPAHAWIVGICGIGMMTVGEFGIDNANSAEITTRNHRAHMPNQRIARVTVINGANLLCRFNQTHDLFAFINGHGHRLFTQHIKTCFEKSFGDFKVCRIGSCDSDQIDSVIAVAFTFEHILPATVGTLGRKA